MMSAPSPVSTPGAAAGSPGPWWVVCLCAEWCNVCRQIRPDIDALAREWPRARFAWVDVEDEEELLGDLDIETFPTVLIGNAAEVRFLGPIQPQAAVLSRMLAGLTGEEGASLPDEGALALLRRIIASRA